MSSQDLHSPFAAGVTPADENTPVDLLVVGAGPTGIAIGAEARAAGLSTVLVDRGPLCAAIVGFPDDMIFFTTRDLLEIAGVPFGIPDDKPTRQQALAYYHGVTRRHRLPLALYEDVLEIRRTEDGFVVETRGTDGRPVVRHRRARSVAIATGYFDQPRKLGVEGEDLPWVHRRYHSPWPHYEQHVAVIGGGNSAAETALDLWRHGARVTIVHRQAHVKPSIKYWLRPDIENRIAEGAIDACFDTVVRGFEEADEKGPRRLILATGEEQHWLAVDAVYVLIGYRPDADFERRCGIDLDVETLVPTFDPETCETNVPGLYVAGTLQAGARTDKIFIENARDHGAKIVRHWLAARGRRTADLGLPV